MQIACEHLREISRARGGLQGHAQKHYVAGLPSCSHTCLRCSCKRFVIDPKRLSASGGLIGREDVLNSLSQINVSPPEELMDAVWATIGGRDDKVSIWKVLSKLPAPRAGAAH